MALTELLLSHETALNSHESLPAARPAFARNEVCRACAKSFRHGLLRGHTSLRSGVIIFVPTLVTDDSAVEADMCVPPTQTP